MARFKSPRPDKKTAGQKQGAIPCLILIGLIFTFLAILFYAAMRG